MHNLLYVCKYLRSTYERIIAFTILILVYTIVEYDNDTIHITLFRTIVSCIVSVGWYNTVIKTDSTTTTLTNLTLYFNDNNVLSTHIVANYY